MRDDSRTRIHLGMRTLAHYRFTQDCCLPRCDIGSLSILIVNFYRFELRPQDWNPRIVDLCILAEASGEAQTWLGMALARAGDRDGGRTHLRAAAQTYEAADRSG
jgi:hypothetical protein